MILINKLNENTDFVRDWGVLKNDIDKTVIVVNDLKRTEKVFGEEINKGKIDLVLMDDQYCKCDSCLFIVDQDEITIVDDKDFLCEDCLKS